MAKKAKKTTIQYGGVTLDLTQSTTQAAVRYTPEAQAALSTKRSSRGVALPPGMDGFELVSSSRGMDSKLDKMRALPEVSVGSHVWQVGDAQDYPLVPTGNLYIEFVEGTDIDDQMELLTDLGLSIKERLSHTALRVSVTPQSPNPIKCVVALQKKKKLVAVAEPEFVTRPADRAFAQPTGRYVNTQWHLENTGGSVPIIDMNNAVYGTGQFKKGADAKVKAAWQAMQHLGSPSIKIAVIDTGFAIDHPQLKGDGTKIRAPFNAATRTSDVSPFVQYGNGTAGVASHGTSCAAVAAGYWDANGILGAAPNARIIPIKLDVLSDDAIRNALDHALLNGADIISCSIGYPQPISLSTFISGYIRKLATEGRGGKGIPIFIAAGNANPASNNQPRQISDFAADPNVICVTASNSLDVRSGYSFYGPNAFLCAPTNGESGVGITTATCGIASDQRSVALGYTSGFGGTSSAAPLTAGVCALILSVNPHLTVGQIRGILAQSCDKIGPAGTYSAQGHSQYYGFGRLNALKAVQLAAGQTAAPAAASTSKTQQGKVTSAKLNVRNQPSTTGKLIKTLQKGVVISLLGSVNGWWKIAEGQYVIDDYVQVL